MPNINDGLREELLETDDEFRRLHEEHQDYKRRLDELKQKSFLSQADEFDAKKIKLHKLKLKDRMAAIIRTHRETRVSA